jgi:hypothetical protein
MKSTAQETFDHSIVIEEKFWYQFCACTKPLTFGAIARGATSCVTIRNSA